jgi:hypothetical protein
MVQESLLWLILIFCSVGPVPDRTRFSSPLTCITGGTAPVRSASLYHRLSRIMIPYIPPMKYQVRPYICPVDLGSG